MERPIKVIAPTDNRKRYCRLCDKPIQNEPHFSIQNVRGGGSYIDINMHDACFCQEAKMAMYEMEKLRK